MDIRIAGLVNDSITDGPGLRLAIFGQGCFHNCAGCHNPHTHTPDGGEVVLVEDIVDKMRRNPLLDGITLTGGEPFLQPEPMLALAQAAHGMGLDVIAYTGYEWDVLVQDEGRIALLRECDYVIDGKFIEALRSLDLEFKGSSNQRLIAVQESLLEGRAVVYENFEAARGI